MLLIASSTTCSLETTLFQMVFFGVESFVKSVEKDVSDPSAETQELLHIRIAGLASYLSGRYHCPILKIYNVIFEIICQRHALNAGQVE